MHDDVVQFPGDPVPLGVGGRGERPRPVLLGPAGVIALPASLGLALGAILLAFAQWRARGVRLWVPIATTAGMLGVLVLGTTFLPAVGSCAVLAVGMLAQADGLRRCPDAVYATGGPREDAAVR